jgi:nucleotide-binding universal stress UspA family protein
MLDRILVPTDGTDVARTAAESAIALADRFDAEVHAIYVLEQRERPLAPDGHREDHRKEAEAIVDEIVDRAANAGVRAHSAVVDDPDPIHRVILEYAEVNDIDCIVMGTHGRTGLDRYVIGSVTERTLRRSPVPVVTVHENRGFSPEEGIGRVLVPTDGSDCSLAAAEYAAEFATNTGSSLHSIYVVDNAILGRETDVGSILAELESSGKAALQSVVDVARAVGVESVETSVRQGTPYRTIVSYASEYDVDCIVMGTHGRTGLDRYLLGSVTDRVVRLADVPVISVKAPEPED